ncbi:MAG TPA: bifunctional YncE family protein/alkaline phosphatase family protein [Chthoniobacterales bacterium]|nr:bifunctional YncE family protein/alkaline phosphatase family protein [Chthoniobacterales bacterium]
MKTKIRGRFFAVAGYMLSYCFTFPMLGDDREPAMQSEVLPTGQTISPLAVPGAHLDWLNPGLADFPTFVAGGGITTVISPDQQTLLALTSGHNLLGGKNKKRKDVGQFVFVFNIAGATPAQKQVLSVPNTFAGIAFDPGGKKFYVGGGKDDNVHTFTLQADGSWSETGSPIALGHNAGNGLGFKSALAPVTAGLAVTADGKTLVVANFCNDSVSIVDLDSESVTKELDLRPGKLDTKLAGTPGGEYPFWVALKGNDTAYVSSIRDREIVVVHLGDQPGVVTRIKTAGNPNHLLLDRAGKYLYATSDNSDSVDIIDTARNAIVKSVKTAATNDALTEGLWELHGASPNSLALSPDEHALYVTNGALNSLAVIQGVPLQPRVTGLIPTGFYPHSISMSGDGQRLYVLHGKSRTGANGGKQAGQLPSHYVEDLLKSSLLTIPVPDARALPDLTRRVAENDLLSAKPRPSDQQLIAQLRRKIKHVVYIIKENRTYDQILGDLDRGNGDPTLAEYGSAVTPNLHHLASQFVCLDNFYDSGDVSANGWPWSTSGRESDIGVKSVGLEYADRGTTYDYEGTNRNINVGLSSLASRVAANPVTPEDPNLLPGTADVAAPDGAGSSEPGRGYIWDAVLRGGKTVRNYGCFLDVSRYSLPPPDDVPLERRPFEKKLVVAYPTKAELVDATDVYYRGFDQAFPDYWREMEWEREFEEFVKNNNLPSLSLVRLGSDHTGSFGTAIDEVNTPERQQADNDYAVGKLVEKLANSRYKTDTLIFILEDDAQSGEDHVDAHRSTAYVVGPYVKQGKVVSEFYTTVSVLRTIEDVLALEHLNLHTATARPMAEIFDLNQKDWNFQAEPSSYLADTKLPVPKKQGAILHPTHDAAYWAEKTKQFDFTKEDNLDDPEVFNRIIWTGLKGDAQYPSERSGKNFRKSRPHDG